MQPSGSPSSWPTSQPSDIPVSYPTEVPIADPSASPSGKPSLPPTSSPSHIYPIIVSNVLTVSRTSVEVDLILSKSGVIYSLLYPVNNSSNVVTKPSFSDFIKHEKYSTSSGLNKVILVYENLIPAHDYALFFMTQHFSNNIGIMPENEIAKTKTIFSTSCCREINMVIVPSVLVAHQNYENFVNIMISSLPLHSLTISLQLFDRSTNQSLVSALSSASVSFDSLSSSLTKTLELTALQEGSYSIVGTVSGQETSKYTLFFQQTGSSMITQNRTSFAMKPADTFLPAPLLTSIVYSGDGSFVNVLFDSSTNFGGYQLLTSFPCSSLLDFRCSFISKCQWSDARSLNAFVKTSDECAKPGDIVKLTQDARIKAACVVTTINACSNYAHWPAMNTSALSSGMKIANALNPILPTIIVSMPSKLSWNCSSLIIDLTGSYGNGGRSWRNMSIIASSDTGVDLSRLQDFLNHKYQMNPPSAIPPSYFPLPGVQYSFQVRMCNFLGACSTSTKSVLVVSEAIPVVKILSSTSSPVRTTRSLPLSLLSYASISSSCLGAVSSVDKGSMQYNWTTYLVNGDLRQPQSSVVSTSKDLSRFLLSAYSLESNKLYEITLLVSSPSGYFQAAAASIQVVVNQGSLVTKVKGGINERNIRVNEILSFDASNSFDEDKGETIRGREAGLVFEWSCVTLEPVINRTSCAAVFEKPVGLTSAVVTATSLSNADNSKVQWTLKVSDSSRSRSTSTSITVAILPLLSPTISLQSNALLGESGGIMNAGQSLQITGSINIPAGVKSNATWSTLGSSVFPLSTLSLTPVLQQFPTSFSSSQSFTMFLVLPANSLAVGTSYTFGLRCQLSYPGKSSLSTITINVNSPPTPGSFSIQPMSGREIIDSFTFLCNQWIDANLPLFYQFSYLSLSGMKIVIRSSSIISYASSILPGGSKTNNGSLTAVADIYDSLSANTTSARVIRVLPASLSSSNGGNVSTSLAATFIASSLSSTSRSSASVDDLMKGTAIASYLLNSANCSLSPNCTALNRLPCYSTSHTCGPCVSSSMIGQKGDSNDKCFESIPVVSSILKKCVGSCSGHGHCNYTSLLTGNTLSACYEGDVTCVASCDCQIGYRMSKNCEMKDEEVQAKRKLRDQVIDGIVTVVDHQDANEQSISSWISSIDEASQVSNELSTKSISSILEIANYAISTVQSNGFSSSNSLSNLLDGLNAISKGMIALTQARNNSRSSSSFSRRLEEVDGSGGVAMLETLQNYSLLLATGMLPGQMPVTALEETFKLHIELLDATGKDTETHRRLSSSTSTVCNSKRIIKIPSTSDQQQSITFPFCGNTSTISPLMLSLVSLSSSLYHNSELTSDSASLFLSSLPCQDPDNCRAEITLEADNSAMMVITEAKNITVLCSEGEHLNQTVRCASSSSPSGWKNHTVSCHGKAETVTATCPAIYTSPTCNGLFGETTSDIGCIVVDYSERNITCSCPLTTTSGRRLTTTNQTAPDVVTTVSVNYVAMLQHLEDNFVTTAVSASSLSDKKAKDSWQAILTLGGLICSVLVALFVAYYADKGALTKISTEEKMLLHAKSTQATKATRKKRILSLSSSSSSRAAAQHHQTASNITQLAEEALPQILNSQSLSHRMWHEIKRHHRWLGIVYYFSDKFPRILRVVSLATNIIVMLFIQSLTYNFTHGNDGSCEALHSEESCLAPRSSFGGTSGNKCYWIASETATTTTTATTYSTEEGSCFFIQPDNSIYVVLFVAVFSALVTTPIALIVDFIINRYLSAPLLTRGDEEKNNPQRKGSKVLPIVPSVEEDNRGSTILEKVKSQQKILKTFHDKYHLTEKEKEEFREKANQELLELKKWLIRYREKTLDKADWTEFNCKSFLVPCLVFFLTPCFFPNF
jgi:hypothetical protein